MQAHQEQGENDIYRKQKILLEAKFCGCLDEQKLNTKIFLQ